MTSLKIVSDHQHLKKKPSLFLDKVLMTLWPFFININKSVGPLHKYDLSKTKMIIESTRYVL